MAKEAPTKFQGEAVFQDVPARSKAGAAGGKSGGQLLGPGCWALHPRSSVPFVTVNCGAVGSRNLSFGEIYEIPEGHFGQVINASFHPGDIVLAETGGDTAPPPPARISVKAVLLADAANTVSSWVDTRLCRKAYLAIHPITVVQGGFLYTVEQQAPTQGSPISPTATAALQVGGVVRMNRQVIGPLELWPLGFGSSEYLDTAGRTVPDVRPMALLDRARVSVTKAAAAAIGFLPGTDAFYILEY